MSTKYYYCYACEIQFQHEYGNAAPLECTSCGSGAIEEMTNTVGIEDVPEPEPAPVYVAPVAFLNRRPQRLSESNTTPNENPLTRLLNRVHDQVTARDSNQNNSSNSNLDQNNVNSNTSHSQTPPIQPTENDSENFSRLINQFMNSVEDSDVTVTDMNPMQGITIQHIQRNMNLDRLNGGQNGSQNSEHQNQNSENANTASNTENSAPSTDQSQNNQNNNANNSSRPPRVTRGQNHLITITMDPSTSGNPGAMISQIMQQMQGIIGTPGTGHIGIGGRVEMGNRTIPLTSLGGFGNLADMVNNLIEGEGGNGGRRPASEQIISSIDSFELTERQVKKMEEDGSLECAVCMAPFEKCDIVKKLNCKHTFHCDCIDSWLRQQSNCPVCRAEITLPAPNFHGGAAGNTAEPHENARNPSRNRPNFPGMPGSLQTALHDVLGNMENLLGGAIGRSDNNPPGENENSGNSNNNNNNSNTDNSNSSNRRNHDDDTPSYFS